jgi:lipoic acid synthetase
MATNASPQPTRPRLPEWLRRQPPSGGALPVFNKTLAVVQKNELHTVCEEARCPNIHDCWGRGTATFMIAGKECTRGCRFCSVETLKAPALPEEDEPEKLADAVERMALEHVVITVVNRDDLPDGGADHYKRCVAAVHQRMPGTTIELLGSDLAGNLAALEHLLADSPLSVFAHNIECVERLEKNIRDPRASFEQSLDILRASKRLRPDLLTKSSLMVGLGETDDEVLDALRRLRGAEVDLVTLGQYLAPGKPGERFVTTERYVSPETFDEYREAAQKMGFKAVASGPLVRSSYQAGALLATALTVSVPRRTGS